MSKRFPGVKVMTARTGISIIVYFRYVWNGLK